MLSNEDKITKERIQYVPLEVITYNSINKIIDAIIDLPEQIIELLRCPTCGGNKILSEDYSTEDCPTCNDTGIRLPEKVVEVVKKPDDLIEDVYVRPTPNARYKATLKIHKEMPSEKVEEKQSKEEGEDLTEIKLSKEDFQQIQESIENPQYNEKLAEALKRPLGFEQEQSEILKRNLLDERCKDCIMTKTLNYSRAELAEKDKEIEILKYQLAEKGSQVAELKIQATSLSAQFERAEMFREQLEEKDKEIERLKIKNEELRKVIDIEIKHLQIIIHDKEVFISELLTKIKRLKAEKDKEIENVKAQRDKYKEALERINEISIYNASGSITRACFCETFKSIANKALKEG